MPNNELNIRYGISALDINNVEYANNDEIMIDKSTGKIYYKRKSDGAVVSYDTPVNISNVVVNEVALAINKHPDSISIDSSDYVIANRFNVSDTYKIDLLSGLTSKPVMNTTLYSSSKSTGFFTCLRTDSDTGIIIDYLRELGYSKKGISNTSDAVVSYDITFTGRNVNEVIVSLTYKCIKNVLINDMTYIDYTEQKNTAFNNGIKTLTGVKIEINSVTCTSLPTVYDTIIDSIIKEKVDSALKGSTELLVRSIDTVSIISDINTEVSFDPDNGVYITIIMTGGHIVTNIENAAGGTNVIISKDKPAKLCMWYELTGK